jgi:hypothetical protein
VTLRLRTDRPSKHYLLEGETMTTDQPQSETRIWHYRTASFGREQVLISALLADEVVACRAVATVRETTTFGSSGAG